MATLTTNIFLPLQKETNYLINHPSRGRVVIDTSPKRASRLCYSLPILFHAWLRGYTGEIQPKIPKNNHISKELYEFVLNHYFFGFQSYFPYLAKNLSMMFLEKADKLLQTPPWGPQPLISGIQIALAALSGFSCATRIRRLSRSMALMKTGSMSRSSWLISLEMLFSHLQRFTQRFRTERCFFGSDKTRKKKNGRFFSPAGFLRGGTDHHPEMVWRFTVVDFALRDQPNAALKHGHGSWKSPALVGPRPEI